MMKRKKKLYIHLLNKGFSEEKIIEWSLDEYLKLKQPSSEIYSYKKYIFQEHKEKIMDEIAKAICEKKVLCLEKKKV